MRRAFNATMDFIVTRPGWQFRMAACAIGVLLAWRFISIHDASIRVESVQELRDSLSASTSLRLHREKDAIGKRIDTQTVTLSRTTHRLDTLWRDVPVVLETPEDTIKALESLPILRRATDSAITSCSEFQISCSEYRRVADSLELAMRGQISGLQTQLHRAKPGKFQSVLKWGEIAAAAWVGYRVGRR